MSGIVHRFNEFEIVTSRRELRDGGQSVAVEPKVYDLLLYLVEHRDRAVSKDELMETIWPGVIVTEAALSRCVMKARQAIHDSANRQALIKTVHGHGYRFVGNIADAAAPARTMQQETERIHIAVLPFRNLSLEPDHEFLAEGLTQDIITNLSRNQWLFVIAGGSTGAYRNNPDTPDSIGDELGAQYLVAGTVRRVADRIRINAELISAATGIREWSERYDRPVADFFEVQDEISLGVAASLGSHVRAAEGRKAEKADTDTLDAWGLVHRGMATSWSRFNRASNLEAESLYRRALAISPTNPKALASLASSIAMKVCNGWSSNIAPDAEEAWKIGSEAIGRAPDDAMVLSHWGHLNTCLGKAREAVHILKRARELDPSSAWTLGLLALALAASGRGQESLEATSEALFLSPRDAAVHWYLAMYGFAYLQLGQYEDAAREAQRSIASFRHWQPPWATLAVALAGLGQWDDARAAARTAATLEPDIDAAGYSRFFAYIVRDEMHSAQIAEWLHEVWPSPAA